MSKFKVGQKWRARNGDVFEIIEDLGSPPYPIIARLNGPGTTITVDRNGRCYFGVLLNHKHDLMELVFDPTANREQEGCLKIYKTIEEKRMINKEWLEERWHLLEAIKSGRKVQYRLGKEWQDLKYPSLDSPAECYRVKPEPVITKTYTNIYPNGGSYIWESLEEAEAGAERAEQRGYKRAGLIITTFVDGEFSSQEYEPLWK